MKYLKQFVIGSSYLIFAPLFYLVENSKEKKYSYHGYTMTAPLWFGVWNIISLIIANYFGLSIKKRFLLNLFRKIFFYI